MLKKVIGEVLAHSVEQVCELKQNSRPRIVFFVSGEFAVVHGTIAKIGWKFRGHERSLNFFIDASSRSWRR
jgi:hypothetical protein